MQNLNALTRPLSISEIDFRVQSINNGGYATILAYKDARTDMSRLDEAFGPFGWQKAYSVINDGLFCGVGILDRASNSWVWKWDVGTESMTEKEKGQASDAFKRACFNIGIGRELYDYPIISVKLNDDEWSKDGGRPKQTWNLKLKEWTWYSEFTDGKLSFLAAKDQNGKLRFKWGEIPKKDEPKEEPKKEEKKVGPVIIKEEPNVSGLLKKKSDDSDDTRDILIADYKALFGKAPHGKMSMENMKKAIDEKIESEIKAEEVEVLSSIKDEYENIEKITKADEFIKWAKEVVSKYIDTESSEAIDEFKELCNNHYSKIK